MLVSVRSFGTEDRPSSKPVPTHNAVYEYIIFKVSDVEDLIIIDTKPRLDLAVWWRFVLAY